jgi:rieske iron-sulfur protein
MNKTPCSQQNAATPDTLSSPDRREALRASSALLLCAGIGIGKSAFADTAAHSRPKVGDQLVRSDANGQPVPLRGAEILPDAKPLQAFPLEPTSGEVRNGTRLNKVILVRIAPADLTDETRPYAAAGVLAYSAVCTHQGCEVSEWVAKDKTLMCYCHFSKFSPRPRRRGGGRPSAAHPAPAAPEGGGRCAGGGRPLHLEPRRIQVRLISRSTPLT